MATYRFSLLGDYSPEFNGSPNDEGWLNLGLSRLRELRCVTRQTVWLPMNSQYRHRWPGGYLMYQGEAGWVSIGFIQNFVSWSDSELGFEIQYEPGSPLRLHDLQELMNIQRQLTDPTSWEGFLQNLGSDGETNDQAAQVGLEMGGWQLWG